MKRQSWGLEKYSSGILVFGLSQKKRISIALHSPPKKRAAHDNDLLEKISSALHISKRAAISYMEIMNRFVDDNNFCSAFDMDENDVETVKSYYTRRTNT